MSGAPAIEFQGLEKSYREGFFLRRTLVLKGLSFSVPQGEIFGFLGANGAGKTTAIKLAIGLQTPDRGKILVGGESPESVQAKTKIGYLPERPYFQANLTANEFLDFHRALFPPEKGERIRPGNEDLFRLVGLPGIGRHRLKSFSKGMLQRIGIAQALVNEPELVILDEPMSGLDPVGRREVRNLMLTLNRQGKTVFFSSHILSDIEALCTRIAFLEKGALKYCGQVSEIVSPGRQDYEILFRLKKGSLEGAAPELSGAQPVGDRFRLIVSGHGEARRAAELCWRDGGEVLSFSPVHRSLEEILFSGGGAV